MDLLLSRIVAASASFLHPIVLVPIPPNLGNDAVRSQ